MFVAYCIFCHWHKFVAIWPSLLKKQANNIHSFIEKLKNRNLFIYNLPNLKETCYKTNTNTMQYKTKERHKITIRISNCLHAAF